MSKYALLGVYLAALIFTATTQAMNVSGSIPASAVITDGIKKGAVAEKKTVYLMNVNLSPAQKARLFKDKNQVSESKSTTLSSKVDTGMNGVPVLDQGLHGTCVTFANTAAIDALLGKGDYVSQLCNLELGSYLESESNGEYMSGWEGSLGPIVLNQIQQYGFVPTSVQQSQTCAGISVYPTYEYSIGNPMPPAEFNQKHEDAKNIMTWSSLLTADERNWSARQGKLILSKVKQLLASGTNTRVTFGVILPYEYCSVGACAKHNKAYDTWAITTAIENDPYPALGGHEMIITGYDDNAIAIDNEGKTHKGLLKLRNSWGSNVGDNGDFYMTYDFFGYLVLEAQKITKKA